MVKKSIIAIAVVALLAVTVQAGSPSLKYDTHWPYTYTPVEICKFPVYMDVGHFVQVKDCHKIRITLQQVDCADIGGGGYPCYKGCTDGPGAWDPLRLRANFDTKVGAKLSKVGPVLNKTRIYFKDDLDEFVGDGEWHKLTICVEAWETQTWKAGPGDRVKVGEVTVTVKPLDDPT